jgi:hypothetical protein
VASRNNDLKMVSLLLNRGAEINFRARVSHQLYWKYCDLLGLVSVFSPPPLLSERSSGSGVPVAGEWGECESPKPSKIS